MASENRRPLSDADRVEVFRIATSSFQRRYGHQFAEGMTDEELEKALAEVLGIFGGSGGPDRLSVTFKGSGLRIWGGWQPVNHVQEKPLFAGKATIAMARAVYGISDPDDQQFSMF